MDRETLGVFAFIVFAYASSLLITPIWFTVGTTTYTYSSRITYVNDGETEHNIVPDLRLFSLIMNTSWQRARLDTVSGAHSLTRDVDGNPTILFELVSMSPKGNATVSYSMTVEAKPRDPPDVDFAVSGTLHDIPEPLRRKYYEAEGSWLIDDDLQALADAIWASQGRTTNVLRIVTSLADWIGRNIKQRSHDVPYYPNETYHLREGDCDDQANLLIALSRILGVPAYLQVGCLRWSSESKTLWDGHITANLKGISYHGWAMVYVPPWGWIPFDMTLGWNAFDSLSVVRSARLWSQDALPMMNVTHSDWVGGGQVLRAQILGSSIYIRYEDALVAQDRQVSLAPLDWRMLSVVALIVSVTVATLYLRKSHKYSYK